MKLLLSFMFISLFISAEAMAEEKAERHKEENYCQDPVSDQDWLEMVAKFPSDLKVQTMHALRIGLCAKVDAGHISLKQGTEIFEAMREVMVNRTFQEQVENKSGPTAL